MVQLMHSAMSNIPTGHSTGCEHTVATAYRVVSCHTGKGVFQLIALLFEGVNPLSVDGLEQDG
jgi:hypothetical protein